MRADLPREVLQFLESMTVPGVLSTLSARGGPVTSAVWFGLHDGQVIISTPADRPKAKNARADGRVSFIVDTKVRPYRGVAIEGNAEVVEDPEEALMASIARRYLGSELPGWMEQRMAGADRVVLRITPRRVRPWNITVQVE
ncbi:MAG: TIGR03618 family F420-dependent PPOX class oxidoreductase [Anaerolineaceae bacterium]